MPITACTSHKAFSYVSLICLWDKHLPKEQIIGVNTKLILKVECAVYVFAFKYCIFSIDLNKFKEIYQTCLVKFLAGLFNFSK